MQIGFNHFQYLGLLIEFDHLSIHCRKSDGEASSLSYTLAFRADESVLHSDQIMHEGQSKPQSAMCTDRGIVLL